jgi:F420-0:gamma-glutamyl ligase-like protein
MIQSSTGTGISQIDHVIVFPGGLAVIETKNWSGQIYGQGNGKQWTVIRRRRKYLRENPIMQNREHIVTLRHVLGDSVPMYNIIVFNRRANLRISNVASAGVIYSRRLAEIIRSIEDEQYTEVQVHAIYEQLQIANITDTTARDHAATTQVK